MSKKVQEAMLQQAFLACRVNEKYFLRPENGLGTQLALLFHYIFTRSLWHNFYIYIFYNYDFYYHDKDEVTGAQIVKQQ